jgi:hypothetical protein
MPPTPMQAWFNLLFGEAALRPDENKNGVAQPNPTVPRRKTRRETRVASGAQAPGDRE